MRPIDADKLYKEVETLKVEAEKAIKNADSMVVRMIATTQLAERDNFAGVVCWMKTLDVAEVVRCKDCKFWTPMDNGISWQNKGRTDGECEVLWKTHCAERHLTQQDHFCSYGERKE